MNTFLLFLTIASLGMTTAAVAVAVRAANENARRSQARVLALAADIHGPGSFSPLPPPSAWWSVRSRGLLIGVAAAAFLVVAAPLTFVRFTSSPSRSTSPAAPQVATRTNPGGPALELVDLSHTFGKEELLVTGRIHNPERAAIRQDLSVVVLLFDAGGLFLGSAESDAVAPSLEPGASATFAVAFRSRTPPARYRVSFRQDNTVVPHIDRRAAGAGPAHTEPRSGRLTS